jgi:ribonuclease G
MKKQLLVSVDRGETRVALLEATGSPGAAKKAPAPKGRKDPAVGYRVAELYFERRGARSIVGNIYKGKVDNVLAGLEAAFVDIGLDKNGFLHVDEIVVPGVDVGRRGRGKEGGSKITELIKPGQEIVVQVVKDPLKSKGARLSMELTIAGRYMVYAPMGEGVGVSRRLDDKERERLRREAKGLDLRGGGAIIRTAAHGASREDFERELQYLFKLREVLDKRVAETVAPSLVFQEADLSVRVVRDIFSEHFERAIVDDPKQHQRLVSFFTRTAPELVDRVELYEERAALFAAYGVEKVIDGLMTRRVDLPSGGYLIIDYAEALTVIDVNSGSFIGRGKGARLEDTITTTNLEAAEEVVNQLRLRDIGGIIVIDFIDMARARNREAVLKTLRKTLDEDRTKTFTAEISKLGLVEMTRQNVTEGVREIISRPCPTCDGDGVIKSEETIAIEFERRLRTLTKKAPKKHEAFLVQMNPRVSAQFTGQGKRVLHALEDETGRRFHFTGSEGLPLDHFDIVMEGSRDDVQERAVPFREGDEVLVHIVEPHMYDVDDAVAKIDGYIISVSGGGRFVGSKKLVRVEHAGRTSATAVLLGEDAVPLPPVEEPPKPARPPRTRTRASRAKATSAAVAVAEPAATSPAAAPENAAAELEPAGDAVAPEVAPDAAGAAVIDDSQPPDEPAAGDGAEATPRRRGRRGGRRRSRAAAESSAAEPSPADG